MNKLSLFKYQCQCSNFNISYLACTYIRGNFEFLASFTENSTKNGTRNLLNGNFTCFFDKYICKKVLRKAGDRMKLICMHFTYIEMAC